MKKRILSLALTLCLLAGLLPCLTVGAAAADRVDAAPYASVEYAKNADVKTGTVRYVCQVPAYSDLFCSDYWGSYGNYANHECFTACISMALSYLGLDATPGALGDYWRSCGHYGTPFATTPDDVAFSGATYSKVSLAEAIARYVGGEGSYSPPIIHLNGYSANGHYVMIIGQDSATEYRVLDPAVKSIYSMTLTNGSTVHYFKGSERVTEAVQYYYPVHHWSAWTAIETDDGAVDMERTCVDCGKTETARIPDPCVGDEYCAGGVFDDMPAASSWMHEGIDYCVLFGLMNGVDKNQFDPMGQTTRAAGHDALPRLRPGKGRPPAPDRRLYGLEHRARLGVFRHDVGGLHGHPLRHEQHGAQPEYRRQPRAACPVHDAHLPPAGRAGFLKNPDKRVESFRKVCKNVTSL